MPAARRVCAFEMGVERERPECGEDEPIDGGRQPRTAGHPSRIVRRPRAHREHPLVHVVAVGWSSEIELLVRWESPCCLIDVRMACARVLSLVSDSASSRAGLLGLAAALRDFRAACLVCPHCEQRGCGRANGLTGRQTSLCAGTLHSNSTSTHLAHRTGTAAHSQPFRSDRSVGLLHSHGDRCADAAVDISHAHSDSTTTRIPCESRSNRCTR